MEYSGNEIILRVENVVSGGPGQGNPGDAFQKQPSNVSSGGHMTRGSFLIGGISAQLLISSGMRVLAATGNQDLANGVREGAEWMFLGSWALAGDPTAMVTALSKSVAFLIKQYQDWKAEQEEAAANYNSLLLLKLKTGQEVIGDNTEISVGKYGKKTLTTRR
jgi:hypothetical protein